MLKFFNLLEQIMSEAKAVKIIIIKSADSCAPHTSTQHIFLFIAIELDCEINLSVGNEFA